MNENEVLKLAEDKMKKAMEVVEKHFTTVK